MDRARELEGALLRQIERLERRLRRLSIVSKRFARARLAVVGIGAFGAFAAFRAVGAGAGWGVLAIAVAVFGVLVVAHDRVEFGRQTHRHWRRIKQVHLARMKRDWRALPPTTVPAPDPAHPFGYDLDLAGPRSLHHLLDTTVTRGGSDRLRGLLLEPALDPDAVGRRQAQVRELAPRTVFRDQLTLRSLLLVDDPDERWDGEALLRWLERHHGAGSLRPALIGLGGLAALNVILVAAHIAGVAPALWLASFPVYFALYIYHRRAFVGLFDEAEYLERALRRFDPVARYLEAYRYGGAPHLARLCAPYRDPARAPSRRLRRVRRIAAAASSQKSEVLWVLLNVVCPWDLIFADRLNAQKQALRADLPVWLDVWYEVEAYNALGHFAYLHPDYAFPVVAETAGREGVFAAKRLGHPLLAASERVDNDVALDVLGRVLIITGSNMAGKSTFLRTVGVNLVLAYAGAPVCAAALHTLPFRLYTCMRVSDSVNDGISYFYAEVRRLKALLDAFHDGSGRPLFFLIDELFRGTNNRERLIGSRALVRTLAGGPGAGMVSTHDLELVRLADEIAAVQNAHFREEIQEGRMVFDYRLRPGPCPTTNALEIMRLEGLPTDA